MTQDEAAKRLLHLAIRGNLEEGKEKGDVSPTFISEVLEMAALLGLIQNTNPSVLDDIYKGGE